MNGSEVRQSDAAPRARTLEALDAAIARARAALGDAIAASQTPAALLETSADEIRRALVHAHRRLRDAEREALDVLDQLARVAPSCAAHAATTEITHLGVKS